jgi:hypothetical protein
VANDMILLREEQQAGVPNFSEDKRRAPIFVPTNSVIINRNTYHIPESLKINYIPPDYSFDTPYMQASVSYARGDGTITVESRCRLKRATIPKQGFDQVKQIRDELDKKSESYIIIQKKTSITPEAESWIKKQ